MPFKPKVNQIRACANRLSEPEKSEFIHKLTRGAELTKEAWALYRRVTGLQKPETKTSATRRVNDAELMRLFRAWWDANGKPDFMLRWIRSTAIRAQVFAPYFPSCARTMRMMRAAKESGSLIKATPTAADAKFYQLTFRP